MLFHKQENCISDIYYSAYLFLLLQDLCSFATHMD